MSLNIVKPLTYKSRIQQIGDGNKFILQDNEIFATNAGCIISPRYLMTDNITFINNTFVDIRASHSHDIGCAQRKLIYTNLNEQDLIDAGLLYFNEKATIRERKFLEALKAIGKYDGNTEVEVWVCDDIPADYIDFVEVGFAENNRLFKQALIATGVKPAMANTMGAAVYLNAKWFLSKAKPMLEPDRLFKDILIT